MTNLLDKFRTDMAAHRAELATEEKRLTAEREQIDRQLEEIRQALGGIDQLIGQSQRPHVIQRSAPASDNSERDALRQRILDVLKSEHPAGLTSYELLTRVQQSWTGSELTARRIGTNAANMPELTGDGQRWYFVPA